MVEMVIKSRFGVSKIRSNREQNVVRIGWLMAPGESWGSRLSSVRLCAVLGPSAKASERDGLDDL